MPRITKAEFAADLTALFPVLEPRSLSPDEISSTLQLVHPFLTGTHKFRSIFEESLLGAVNATIVQGGIVPDGQYRYILAAAVGSDGESTARRYALQVNKTGNTAVTLVNDDVAVVRNVDSQSSTIHYLSLKKGFLLGPGMFLQGAVEAISVGNQLKLVSWFVDYLLLEPHPQF